MAIYNYTSALEIFLSLHYINLHFTYLLTMQLTHGNKTCVIFFVSGFFIQFYFTHTTE